MAFADEPDYVKQTLLRKIYSCKWEKEDGMKKKLMASFLMVSVIFTNMPQDLWNVRAADKTIPGNGKAEITEFISAPETIDAIAQIEELYKDINLKNAENKAFGTKTLIIKTGVQAFDTFGAVQCICIGDNNYVLSYEDVKSAGNAYQRYSGADWIDFVEPDGVVELEDAGSAEKESVIMETEGSGESVSNDAEKELSEKTGADGTEAELSAETVPDGTETEASAKTMPDGTETDLPTEAADVMEIELAEKAVQTAACVAVIDTGIHADAGTAGLYMDDGEEALDENGHGTQVANLIADALVHARITKEQVRLLPVKVADEDGRCTVLQLYLGILSAMEQGADLLNISLGTKNLAASSLLEQAMREAYAAGITVVTSAGNDGADVAGYTPANIPSVITVGSVNEKKGQSAFSNYGQTLDCVSYGENVTVTGLYGEKTKEDGTSYAAALVTAELALQMTAGEADTPKKADAYIQSAARDLGKPGWDVSYGYGLVGNRHYWDETGDETEQGTEIGKKPTKEETEAEETEEPGNSEELQDVSARGSEYLQKVNIYNLLIGDIEILAANQNIESTKLLADTMKKSIGGLFENQTDIHAAFDEDAAEGIIAGKHYAGAGNAVIDEAAKELEGYLKECALAADSSGKAAAGFEEKLDGFVEFLSGFQGSEPLAGDVYIEAATTKTVGDVATLQSIAQTAGDFTVKLTRGITLTSEVVVTNGCTLRLQSNKENTRRTISLGTLPESVKTSGMCMFRVDGMKKNQLIIGTANGKYPVTLDGKKQPHNGFLIYNSTWAGNVNGYRSITRIYPGTILQNNVMYFDSTNAVNGASGSAICNYGTLYIEGGTIQNNSFLGKAGAKVGEGAGIANYNKFYMSGGEIKGNVATNGNGIMTGKMGNVAALAGYEMKITGGSIHDNGNADDKKYTSNGGGILINPDTPVTIGGSSIDSVKIYGNMADYGGGIANYGTCSLGKCRIYENYSESEGGGVLNRARADTEAAPALNINGAYVYHNYCSKTDSSYAGGIASLKRKVNGREIVPQIAISSGYFYDNDGFSIHIDSGTLSFGDNVRFGFSSYSSASFYKVTEEWYGSGVCNTGGTVNVTGSARMFVPAGAVGIKNTGTLNIGDGADFAVFCQDAESAIQNTGKLTSGKITKNSSGSILYPYTIDGSASYGIKNAGRGTAYLTGRIRGNYTVRNTAKSEDKSADNQNIGIGVYNTSSVSYSSSSPYAVILQGTAIDGTVYNGYVGYAQTGIYNNAAAGSVGIKQGEVASCSGSGISNKGKVYIQNADAKIHHNGKEGIYNHSGAALTVSSACSIYNNSSRGIYNGGTVLISAGAKVYGNTANGITNGENGIMTVSGAADIYANGGNGVRNYKTMTISGEAKVHGNIGHGLENSGTTVISGNTDIYGNGKSGISNGAGYKLTMTRGNVRGNAAGGIINSGAFELAGGFVYGNSGYGVHNLGTCNISGIKIGFSSFTSNTAYATSQNASGGIANYGTLHLISGGYVNGGNAPAVVNAGTMNADAGAATVLMSISGESVLNNSGKLDTAYTEGKTPIWVLSGNCQYGIKNTGSMRFSGKADGRYKVTATRYVYQESSRGFTEAAIYNSSVNAFHSSYPYAAYLYGEALLAGSGKDGLRTDKGTVCMNAAINTANKNGVNIGNNAALQILSADAKIYANEVGVYNNGTVQMSNANIYRNTEHGVYQNGNFYMSGAAKVNVNNDVCLPPECVITVNGALTTNGVVANVTPLKKTGMALERITNKEDEEKCEIGRVIVKTSYAGSKGSDALFNNAEGYRFTLSNGGVLRPGDYMDREILAKENHTEVSGKDIVVSNRYTVAYEKNIDEKDGDGNLVDVEVVDLPVDQDKFWCENLQMPNKEGIYISPAVSTEPYAAYYRFLNWNDRADGNGNTVDLPSVYRENEDMTIYALWQKLFNVAYIGNEQSTGDDFTEHDIFQESTYTFDDNMEPDGKEHFTKFIENSYIDEETGEEVKQETTAKVVQWSLLKNAEIGETNYGKSESIAASELFRNAQKVEGAVTVGFPNADYGLFPRLETVPINTVSEERSVCGFEMPDSNEFSMNLFAAAYAEQPFINLYAVWDEGPMIEAYDLYYTLEEAQSTTDTEGITMEELLSRAAAVDKEDGILPHGKEVGFGAGKKTTFIVSGYAADDFSSLTAEGSVTINYLAKDTAGNVTNRMVTVNIIDTSAKKAHKGTVRFISEKYLDTLSKDSVWKVDREYHEELTAVLANHRENTETYTEQAFGKTVTIEKPGTGTWAIAPEETWVFTHEQVNAVKDYVDASGIGISKGEGALSGFLAKFASCRK